MDWQEIWQDLEDAYDKIREKKLAGATFRERRFNRAVDNVLDLLNSAQDEAEGRGAVPVEPVDCPEHESSDQCHSPEDHVGDGPCQCTSYRYVEDDYGRCHCKD